MRYHYTPFRMAKIQNTDNTKSWQGCGTTGTFSAGRNAKWYSHFGRHFGGFLKKTKCTLTIISSNHAPWYLPTGAENLCPHKNLHTDVYSSFIHNCPNLEATKISSVGEWLSKLIYPDNVFKKKWATEPWKGMEETKMHVTKWKKSIWKGYILYDILEGKIMETVKRSVVTRG